MDFFGIGTGELIVIMVVALIFLGPEKMVGAARTMGKFTRQITQASRDFTKKLEDEVDKEAQSTGIRETGQDISRILSDSVDMGPAASKEQKAPDVRSDNRPPNDQPKQQ